MGYVTNDLKEYQVDAELADKLIGFLKKRRAKSIVDFGCGSGFYVNRLIEAGFEAVGFDTNPFTPDLSGGSCRVGDLSYPLDVGCFDWVVSLETGEHIEPLRERFFLDNIDRAASVGVVLSWAIPGQTGVGHVNERPNDYIIEQMTKRGFVHNLVYSRGLRAASTLPWFANTIMVFERA